MSAKAETLRVTTIHTPKLSLYVAATAALRRWGSRLQLGSSYETEIGRHTGSRC
jgi:hypothetical protein